MSTDTQIATGVQNLNVGDNLPVGKQPEISAISSGSEIPLIDLKGGDPHGEERRRIVQQMAKACEEYGAFEIVNHGVPGEVVQDMTRIAMEFFEMPLEKRAYLYSEDPSKVVRVVTRLNNDKERGMHWVDYIRHPCHPLKDFIDLWPEEPKKYREITGRYATEVKSLELKLLGIFSEGLDLETNYLNESFGTHTQILGINYYPACPDRSKPLGVDGHTDPVGFTILLQEVPGLQVMKDGRWITLDAIRNAFVVYLGNHFEVISNGRYKSVEHRALTHSSVARVSIPTFFSPSMDAVVTPAEPLLNVHNPPLYKGYKVGDFLNLLQSTDMSKESVSDHFRV